MKENKGKANLRGDKDALNGVLFRRVEERDAYIIESFAYLDGKGSAPLTKRKINTLQEQEITVMLTPIVIFIYKLMECSL